MNQKYWTSPEGLERGSFLYSELRLAIAALSLFLGGVPTVRYFLPGAGLFSFITLGLSLAWILSGLASVYLLYRYTIAGNKLFGKKDIKDAVAFFVVVISGLNLGVTGATGFNAGMSILSGYPVFVVTGVIYLAAGAYLYTRWAGNGKKIF